MIRFEIIILILQSHSHNIDFRAVYMHNSKTNTIQKYYKERLFQKSSEEFKHLSRAREPVLSVGKCSPVLSI